MKNSKIKLAATALFLVGSIGTFSAIAHESEGKGMMSSESMGKRMGNYIPLPASSANFFRNGVHAVSLRCHPVMRQ
jgi:hypothetical protein